MRIHIVLFAFGAWLMQRQAELPDMRCAWVLLLALPALALARSPHRVVRRGAGILMAALWLAGGFLWAAGAAHIRLSDALAGRVGRPRHRSRRRRREPAAALRAQRALRARRRACVDAGCPSAGADRARVVGPIAARRQQRPAGGEAGRALAAARAVEASARHCESARLRLRSMAARARRARDRVRETARRGRAADADGATPCVLGGGAARALPGAHPRCARGTAVRRRHRRARRGRPARDTARAVANLHAHRREPPHEHLGAARDDGLGARLCARAGAVAAQRAPDAAFARAQSSRVGGRFGGISLHAPCGIRGAGATHAVHAHRGSGCVVGGNRGIGIRGARRCALRCRRDARSVGGDIGRLLAFFRRCRGDSLSSQSTASPSRTGSCPGRAPRRP